MKKLFVPVAFIALSLAGVSCRKYSPQELPEMEFTAVLEDTKTVLTSDRKINWEAGDEISINGRKYVASLTGTATKALFTKKAGEGADPASPYQAYFPSALYNAGTPALPSIQTFVSGKFSHIPMYASSTTNTLSFKNICAVLAIKVKSSVDPNVVAVTLSSSNLAMSGAFTVVSDAAVLSSPTVIANTVTLDCGSGVPTDAAGTVFHIAIPAGTYSNLKVDVDGVSVTAASLTVERNRIYPLDFQPVINLSATESANCYVVSDSGNYKFRADVKGNSSATISGTPTGAKVIWESLGTDASVTAGDIVRNVSYSSSDKCVSFKVPSAIKNGNAVIALVNGDVVLWSWHIWVCKDYDPVSTAQTYSNGAGVFMDRNLGATSVTKGDVKARGLFYQWGRKDPFLGSGTAGGTAQSASTKAWVSTVSDSSSGNVDFAVANPSTFIYSESDSWLTVHDNTLWGVTKTMYDPCPPGWKVPVESGKDIWKTALDNDHYSFPLSLPFDSTGKGVDFATTTPSISAACTGAGVAVWYPAAGSVAGDTGVISSVSSGIRMWSVAHFLFVDYSSGANCSVNSSANTVYSTGQSVRCLKIVP